MKELPQLPDYMISAQEVKLTLIIVLIGVLLVLFGGLYLFRPGVERRDFMGKKEQEQEIRKSKIRAVIIVLIILISMFIGILTFFYYLGKWYKEGNAPPMVAELIYKLRS